MPLTPDFQELLLSMLGHTKLPVLGFDYRGASSDHRCYGDLYPSGPLAIQAFLHNTHRRSPNHPGNFAPHELLQNSFLLRSSTFQPTRSQMADVVRYEAQEAERMWYTFL